MSLLEKVLNYLEPDEKNRTYWKTTQELFPISQAECMELFKEEILDIKENGEKIIVAGDYDCDGICATTILVRGLRKLGIECGFYIPDRIKEGYGLSPRTVQLAYKKGYSTIITVDNGVKAFDALEVALQLGMRVIVSDHHTIGEKVPCDILIHPDTLEDCFSNLCGAAIAYECLRVLGVASELDLQLACIASIGDVMEVTKETRAIIQQGILLMNDSKMVDPHLSILSSPPYNDTNIAFQIVPRLNAVGRLSNMANVNNVVRFFLDQNSMNIKNFQEQMEFINNTRKQLSERMSQMVLSMVNPNDEILIVSHPTFHEGIIGLVAGRICAQFKKPAIIMSISNGMYKASMRAPEGFDCMEFFNDFDYFTAFGGHKLAAGFSFKEEHISYFKAYIERRFQSYSYIIPEKEVLIIDETDCTVEEIESLDCIRPFGPGFVYPNMKIENPKIKSAIPIQNHKHMKYITENNLECMQFNCGNINYRQEQISSFIGNVSINAYRQKKSANFIIDEIETL